MPFALYVYIYFGIKAYRELKLVRALDEDKEFSVVLCSLIRMYLLKSKRISCLSEAVIISKNCNYVYPCCN